MLINCPNCNGIVEQARAWDRSDPHAGDAWYCFRCPAVVCVHCYITHNTNQHPGLYQPPKPPTKGHKKNKHGEKR